MHVGYEILRIEHCGWMYNIVLENLEIETFIIKLPHFKSNLGAKSFFIASIASPYIKNFSV